METTFGGFKSKLHFLLHKLRENDLGLRLLIGIIAWLSLSTFIHFREVKIEMLEINTTANRYIVAQVDFQFQDEEATIILRQEAISDIGDIYQIEDKTLRQSVYDLEYFLVHNSGWRDEIKGGSLEEVYKVLESVKTMMKNERFTDSLTQAKMKKLQINPDEFFIVSASVQDKKALPESFWEYLRQQVGTESNKSTLDYILAFLQKRNWPLEIDKKANANIRDYVENSVSPKFTEVKAGTKIITQGEKVRSRHIEMLKAMKQALSQRRNVWAPFSITGNLLLGLIFIVLCGMYIKAYQAEILRSVQKLALLVCIFILTLALAKLIEYILLQISGNMVDAIHYPLVVPFAAILLLILFNARLALFCVSIFSIILATTLTVDHVRFLIINLIASLIIVVTTKSLRRRKDVFRSLRKKPPRFFTCNYCL